MNTDRRAKLEAAGFKVGSAAELLGVSEEEGTQVELRLAEGRPTKLPGTDSSARTVMPETGTPPEPPHEALAIEIDHLVDEYRARCRRFLREDFYPADDAERLRTLTAIERHADRRGFQRARKLKEWLLRDSCFIGPQKP